MYFEYDETENLTRINIERNLDVCATCRNRENCPLLLAIVQHIVYPSAGHLEFSKCAGYKKEVKPKHKKSKE